MQQVRLAFDFLSPDDLRSAAAVCKEWNAASQLETVWQQVWMKAGGPMPFPATNSFREEALRLDEAKRIRHVHLLKGSLYSAWGDRIVYWKLESRYQEERWSTYLTRPYYKSPITAFKVRTIGMQAFLLTGCLDGRVMVWLQNQNHFRIVKSINAHKDRITAFEGFDDRIFSGSNDAEIHVMQYGEKAEACKPLEVLKGHEAAITAMEKMVHPVYVILFSASLDATIRIWSNRSKTFECIQILRLQEEFSTALTYGVEERCFMAGTSKGNIRIWEQQGQQWTEKPPLNPSESKILSITSAGSLGSLCFADSQGRVNFWKKNSENEQWEQVSTIQLEPYTRRTIESGIQCPNTPFREFFFTSENQIKIFEVPTNPSQPPRQIAPLTLPEYRPLEKP